MNKYYQMLDKILEQGKPQANKKGNIRYLLNEQLSLSPADLPLKNITLNLGNVHIYENNINRTKQLLDGDESVKFDLNV